MQKHYRIFLDRIQIQLETIGGGGAVRILDMDDLDEDIRRNPQDYDGEFLQIQYDSDKNQTIIGAAPDVVNDINDLDDVDTEGAEDGMVLVYIAATGKWEARVVQYIGVNIDANPDPEIQDYGGYS
jgi:polyribonucleotide nucleotidyltransferase